MAKAGRLEEYAAKRDFTRTKEPAAGPLRPARQGEWPKFCVQKHDASHLHYDLRLEAEGVLKSWAVPKGPSLDSTERRLAMRTEDHPLEYLGFEGVIPQGEYGGGAMIVWDVGYFRNLTHDRKDSEIPVAVALEQGRLKFWLEGSKLRGAFALTRTSSPEEREKWLLVKVRDELADPGRDLVGEETASVLTGRTVEQVFAEEDGR